MVNAYIDPQIKTTHAPTEAVETEVRHRPYLGRYRAPPPPEASRVLSLSEKISCYLSGAKWARDNAHNALRDGDMARASHAYARAHSYLETVRALRATA